MSDDKIVSVAVPVYNHEKYIEQCLLSILAQKTSFNFEIVVGDDCSTDGTREKIKSISNRFPGKFRLLLHEKNLGPPDCAGKNNSISIIQAACGKYVAFCEGDDYWTDINKLQKQVDFLEKNEDYCICFHKIKVIKEREDYVYEVPDESIADTSTVEELLRKGNFIHTATCVLRNPFPRILPDWYYKMKAGDFAYYLLALKDEGKKIKFLPEEMAAYRIHGAGVWGSKSKIRNYVREIESFMILYDVFLKRRDLIKNAIYNRYLFITDYYRKNGDARKTLIFEMKIIRFCITFRFKPDRNHFGLAMSVLKDYVRHKLKLS
jgi:glycosyltransferase involved in cell wall biosynthesis